MVTRWYEAQKKNEIERQNRDEIDEYIKYYNHMAASQNGGVVIVNPEALRIALARAVAAGNAKMTPLTATEAK